MIEAGGHILGGITVQPLAPEAMADWAGGPLSGEAKEVELKPYLGKAYRSPVAGVYVYGDNDVQESSLRLAGAYIDRILSNSNYDIGQRIADGMVQMGGGCQIIAYGHHAYQQPSTKNTYSTNFQYYLYVEGFGGGIFQTTEANLLRDIPYTRYKGEFIAGHEGAHSIETAMQYFTEIPGVTMNPGTGAQTNLNGVLSWVYSNRQAYGGNPDRWPLATYAGSNRAEYWATLSNMWHGTMRESASGKWDGTLSPINTREELYSYDPNGYAICKFVYYNGETGLNGLETGEPIIDVDAEARANYAGGDVLSTTALDASVLKWGATFADTFVAQVPNAKWVYWAASNYYRYNPDDPQGDGLLRDVINEHPYYNRDAGSGGGGSGGGSGGGVPGEG